MLVMCREAMGSKVVEGQRGGKSWSTLSLSYLGDRRTPHPHNSSHSEGLSVLT